jgi:hypothetical protein
MPEPSPGWSRALPRFLVGRDRAGHWVVQDRQGLCGGLFVNRAEALRFAMHEDGGDRQAAIMVSGYLELSVSRPRSPATVLPAPRGGRHV